MKALVIGGTLFIGRRLVKRLLADGHEVTVLHRSDKHSYGDTVANLVADRNDPAAMKQALAGRQFDWVFDNVYDWERGTTAAQVIATARSCGDNLARYVFMSSCASYGDGLNVTEDAPLAPDDHPESYVANKAASERALLGLHASEGFPAVTLRPPYVYGPENPFYREQFFWDRMRDGRTIIVPGDGNRLMHFVYVYDLAEACLLAAQTDEASGHGFNVGQRAPITQEELVREIAATAGSEPQTVHVPRKTIEAAGGEVMGDKLYFGFYFDMPPITQDVSKAKRILGLEPTPFADGLAETYAWYWANHQRPEIDYTFEDGLIAAARG